MGAQGVEGVGTREAGAEFFRKAPVIVLVANSDEVDARALAATYGDDALFVFFNKVYKVLDEPFARPSLLVARSSPAGANIVYRREVADVTRPLEGPNFRGILNLRAGEQEVFSSTTEFGRTDVGHLDLSPDARGFYPDTHLPTSGFALALFLTEHCPGTRIVLAGFSAKRSAKWRLFEDHDWNFEQVVLRLLHRSGKLEHVSAAKEAGAYERIARRIEGMSANDVSLVAAEVLAERLDNANSAIDELLKLTRAQSRLRGLVQRLKPRTRKQKLAETAPKQR